ncbi:MAG: S9 family peptidase, partial [Hymenobacter sp.]
MNLNVVRRTGVAVAFLLTLGSAAQAQVGPGTQWTKDGYGYFRVQQEEIVELDARQAAGKPRTVLSKQQLTPQGQTEPLHVRRFALSDDGKLALLNTNTKKVWRYDTRGD